AFPLLLSQILPVGVIGLVGAGMLAAFMSTHDSYLLCWASVLVEDVVAPLAGGRLSTQARRVLARGAILLIGAFLLIWSLWYPLGQDLWDYMAISGAIYFTGASAVLVCGLYWRGASRTGAVLALSAGLLSVLGLEPMQQLVGLTQLEESWQFDITSAHVGLAATVIAFWLMIGGSLAFPDRPAAGAARQEAA
ncbi:MAG: hypothetical protein KDA41_12875, partial [Planctomycetales bacterium]|nr:hypothetical protein [Planctomycetales bacterium]